VNQRLLYPATKDVNRNYPDDAVGDSSLNALLAVLEDRVSEETSNASCEDCAVCAVILN
jgi:hypothetical protein